MHYTVVMNQPSSSEACQKRKSSCTSQHVALLRVEQRKWSFDYGVDPLRVRKCIDSSVSIDTVEAIYIRLQLQAAPSLQLYCSQQFLFSCCIQNGIGFLSGNLWTIYVHIIEVHWLDRSTMTNTANCLQKVAERSKLLPDKINIPQHNSSCKKIF